MTADAPVWVFGYGSLVWRPAMAYVARRAGRVEGWARRFWQASTDHRGTVEAPGRVLTLVPGDGAVWGMAYAIARDAWPDIEAALEVREQGGYARVTIDIGLAAGEQAGRVVETVAGLLYIATPANPQFIGPEPLEVTADIVRRSHGPSGSNVDYVLELDRALHAFGAADPDVSALAERVRAARSQPTPA
ncbi:MAG: gamma-glutamylcyclotransferase [Deltaproteobacteria bacterium]|nr:MAG: gamma-glutamylcyclotransferase [Deltaproteobacteria bacterium]TMQ18158.1 MAG: gamma-glutamylcyclotransferase [Deltaproteobacteria bacterium]